MASKEQELGKIKRLIDKLRYITLAIQIMPFVYSGLYIIAMILYLVAPDGVCYALDALLYVSPVIVACFLVCSVILELCRWHKTACSLPLIPQAIVFVDHYVVELTEVEAYICIAAPAVLSMLLIVAAYNVFIK